MSDGQKRGRKYTEEIYGTEYKEKDLREKDQVLINVKYKPQKKRSRHRNPEIDGNFRKNCGNKKDFVRVREFQEKSCSREGTQAE